MEEENWEISEESMNFQPLTSVIPDSKGEKTLNKVIRRRQYVFDRIELTDLETFSALMKCKSCNEHFNHNPNSNVVRMCDSGHIYCNKSGCGPRCPAWEGGKLCHKQIISRQFPLYFHLYSSPIFPCQFNNQGCSEVLTGPKLLDHEKTCKFDPFFSCYYKQCPRQYIPFPELIDHLKKSHGAMITKSPYAEIPVPSLLEKKPNGQGYEYSIPTIFSLDGFNLALVTERRGDSIHFSVLLMNRITKDNNKLRAVQCNIEKSDRIHPWVMEPKLSGWDDGESGFSMTISQFQDLYVTKAKERGGKDFFKFRMFLRYK